MLKQSRNGSLQSPALSYTLIFPSLLSMGVDYRILRWLRFVPGGQPWRTPSQLANARRKRASLASTALKHMDTEQLQCYTVLTGENIAEVHTHGCKPLAIHVVGEFQGRRRRPYGRKKEPLEDVRPMHEFQILVDLLTVARSPLKCTQRSHHHSYHMKAFADAKVTKLDMGKRAVLATRSFPWGACHYSRLDLPGLAHCRTTMPMLRHHGAIMLFIYAYVR